MGKKAGKGIFAKKVLSPALAGICGAKSLPRTEVTKKIWGYIKSHKLNEGRIIKPDSALKAVFPVASLDMLKMPLSSASTCLETMSEPRRFSRRVPTPRRALESRPQELDSCNSRWATQSDDSS